MAQILDRAVRCELFELTYHRARDRDLRVKREKPIYRRYLEADELLDLLDAALEIDHVRAPIRSSSRRPPGTCARSSGLRGNGSPPASAVEQLIVRAQAMRTWLLFASGCECTTLDVCELFATGEAAAPLADPRGMSMPRA